MSVDPLSIASTLQFAHTNENPSPEHDINPSTVASEKVPVEATSSPPSSPSDVHLQPVPRRKALPPLPDLRFEQSYLASIPEGASWRRVAYITIQTQVFLPLLQGTVWTLALAGWRHWNRGAQMAGTGIGARIRRWWWDVNGWNIPARDDKMMAEKVTEVGG